MKLAISFDYDSPEGYRNSFGMQGWREDADQQGTEALLRVLSDHDAAATFGVVGRAALDGRPPEHCPEQIRAIHAAGHEVASHSMYHRFLPPMRRRELFEDAAGSRRALENCIGAPVRGFIPPFNRPMHFPQRRAISVSEMLGLHGRGRGRQSLGSLLGVLGEAGFGWSRVSFEDKLERIFGRAAAGPAQPFVYRGVVAIPLHSTGFGEATAALVRRYLATALTLAIYGHPNQALENNDQSAAMLDRFLADFAGERRGGRLQLHTMGEIEGFTRGAAQREAERAFYAD